MSPGGIALASGDSDESAAPRPPADGRSPDASQTRGSAAAPEDATAGETGPPPEERLRVRTAGWDTDFSQHSVPLEEFFSGGPGKDGIPAINEPAFTAVADADEYVEDREPVILLDIAGDVRAYPIQILIWHEIVNDIVGGVPVAVTFCPLCNTALVFERTVGGRLLDFGTTGNLRNSDLVMFDRQTESWWQQFDGEAIVGELTGTELGRVPATLVAWDHVVAAQPDAQVLSRDTGSARPYGQNPYAGYDSIDTPPFFPVERNDSRLAPKARVVFVERGGESVAIPLSFLASEGELEVEVGGDMLVFSFIEGVRSSLGNPAIAGGQLVGSAEVRDAVTGELVPSDQPFWFAVGAFRPDTRIVDG